MLPPVGVALSFQAFVILAVTIAVFARLFVRELWDSRVYRVAFVLVVLGLGVAHALWASRAGQGYWGPSHTPACVACIGVITLSFIALSLPIAGAGRGLVHLVYARRRRVKGEPASPGRRRALKAIAGIAPIAATGVSAAGFLGADRAPLAPKIRVPFPNLPPALDGLTILQLSDMHLGISKNVDDLEKLLVRLEDMRVRPDLIVLTGDIAEDPTLLAPTLALCAGVRARLGAFAVLGNHEHFRLSPHLRTYERGPVPLLMNQGVTLKVGDSHLYLAGIDDTFRADGDPDGFNRRNIAHAMQRAPRDAFSILLAHRPEAFVQASDADIALTLSGHTHGGQIGFDGRSAFAHLVKDRYLWGKYARGRSSLYTTSGFGHWFPFRLGCPHEAPLITLTGAPRGNSRNA